MSEARKLGWFPEGGFYADHRPVVPTEDERDALVEAILGEPGDWVPRGRSYEPVQEHEEGNSGGLWFTCGSGPEVARANAHDNPEWLRNKAANYLALARHIEARDAAAKERERAEEGRVRAKAEQLEAQLRFHGVIDNGPLHVNDLRARLVAAVRDGVRPRMPADAMKQADR